MDPRVREDDEQEPRVVRNFATVYIRHSRAGRNPYLTSAGRTLFVGLIDSKTSIRFKMDPRVREDDEQEPRAVRNFATFDIRHS